MTRHLYLTTLLLALAVLLLSACELFPFSSGGLGQPCDDKSQCHWPLVCSAQTHRCEASLTDGDGEQESEQENERDADLVDPDTDTAEHESSEELELEENAPEQEFEAEEEAAELDSSDGDGENEKVEQGDADTEHESEVLKEVEAEGDSSELDSEADNAIDGDLMELESEKVDGADSDADSFVLTPGFVRINAGTFTMGSPSTELGRGSDETPHQVILTYDFEMSKYETTQAEFKSFSGKNPSWFGPNADGADCGTNCPVERVNWYEAVAYANWLSTQKGLTPCYIFSNCTGTLGGGCGTSTSMCSGTYSCTVSLNGVSKPQDCQGFRLPTEAEWEYAIRSGTTTAFYIGEITNSGQDPKMDLIGWYDYNSDAGSGKMTHPGGQKAASAWGLYDMSGNVWEWVWDWYQDAYESDVGTNPVGPSSKSHRVRRGGDFHNNAEAGRSAFRSPAPPIDCHLSIGFRLVRSLPATIADGDLDTSDADTTDTPVCTDGPCCQGGVPVSAGQACLSGQDSLACTDDVCDAAGTCTHPRKANTCLIGNTCYANHDPNPANACKWCDAAQNAWADKPASEACNDSQDCTYNDHCTGSGECTGTTITCSDDAGSCGKKRQCQGTDTCKESFPGYETSCEDHATCTYGDHCNGSGGCGGTTHTCSDAPGICGTKRQCNGTSQCTEATAGLATACEADALSCTDDFCDGRETCVHRRLRRDELLLYHAGYVQG